MNLVSLVVIVPTRGRPDSAHRLYQTFEKASVATIVFVVDDDDPSLAGYEDLELPVLVAPRGRPGIVDPLNWAVRQIVEDPAVEMVGFLGDDHLPRTEDWDVRIIETLRQLGTGICYGNDLLMGEKIPTAVFMTADIIRTLGYMAPPPLIHLWVDNSWLEWGKAIDRIRYLEDVIIEHLHPLAGKSDWDPTYDACNNPNVEHDKAAFASYSRLGLRIDVKKLKKLIR